MTLREAIAKFRERFENSPRLQEIRERLENMRVQTQAEAEAAEEAPVEE